MPKTKVTKIPTSAIIDLSAATGPVVIKMTNDYLFWALLQHRQTCNPDWTAGFYPVSGTSGILRYI